MEKTEIIKQTVQLVEEANENTYALDSYTQLFSWNNKKVHIISRSKIICDDSTPMIYFVLEAGNSLRLADKKETEQLKIDYLNYLESL